MSQPTNDLERALVAAMRGPAGQPEFYRQLRDSEVVFLMPYHPDLEGTMSVTGGDRVAMVSWKSLQGEFVPVFTSRRVATWAIKTRAPGEPYALAAVKGETFFLMVAPQKQMVIVNPGCPTGEVLLVPEAVQAMADGSIFKPITSVEKTEEQVIIMDPADYPTDFIQPLFQFLRGRPEVRAAWIFQQNPDRKSVV